MTRITEERPATAPNLIKRPIQSRPAWSATTAVAAEGEVGRALLGGDTGDNDIEEGAMRSDQ
jgi:hypothetical protein